MADRLTHLEPVVDALKEQCNRTDARLDELERDSRAHWEAHTKQLHDMKIDMTTELNNVKTEQRVNAAVFGLVFGILTFLAMTIVGWTIKSSLDAVRASINQHQQTKP
jgi:hypothetical protein